MRWIRIALLVGLAVAAAGGWLSRETPRGSLGGPDVATDGESMAAQADGLGLPAEAHRTLRLIEAGGPFPYDRDGTTFQNRERRLPAQPPGYYREYTVPTPGSPDRGARRIVSGGNPPVEFYYTDDHYRSFRRIEVPRP
jgi:guanyl-specific ribonuclease Sa